MPITLRSKSTQCLSTEIYEFDGRSAVLVKSSEKGSRLSVEDGLAFADAVRSARQKRIPFMAVFSTSGADPADGADAAFGWARAARELSLTSGVIPILIGVDGPLVSSVSLMLGLSDFNVFTTDSVAFVSGPHTIETYTGTQVEVDEIGAGNLHSSTTGVASVLVDDGEEIFDTFREFLSFFPNHVDELPPTLESSDIIERETPEAGELIPESATGSYDVREVIASLADDGDFFEVKEQWASNLVTGFARFGETPVGIVANQTQALAGSIDIPASQKGARFVALCDAFNIPLLTMVDTSGFLPGKDLEWRGMIRHGAQMAFAYARATVPRIGLILRKSYGGAYIVMDSRYMGNDVMYAWPSAEVAVMGAKGAVGILHRKSSPEEQEELVKEYEDKYLTPYPAAERGSITEVISPSETRTKIINSLWLLQSKKEKLRPRKHDNSPL